MCFMRKFKRKRLNLLIDSKEKRGVLLLHCCCHLRELCGLQSCFLWMTIIRWINSFPAPKYGFYNHCSISRHTHADPWTKTGRDVNLYTFGAVDKSAFHLIEIYTVNSIIHFSKKSALEILADNRGFGKYRKIPKISPSMYKPPKPATQKTLR